MNEGQVIPLYRQVTEFVIDSIDQGKFTPGGQIPSQRELCEQFNISLMTARRAINELISEGFIYAVHGKGLFVAEKKQPAEAGPLISFTDDMRQRGMNPSSVLLDISLVEATPFLSRILSIAPESELVLIKRLRLADNRPIALQTNYVVSSDCPGLIHHNIEKQGLFQILLGEYGLHLSDTRTTIESVLASVEEGQLLDLPLPAALLMTEQLTFLNNGHAVEFVRTKYRGDRYNIQTR